MESSIVPNMNERKVMQRFSSSLLEARLELGREGTKGLPDLSPSAFVWMTLPAEVSLALFEMQEKQYQRSQRMAAAVFYCLGTEYNHNYKETAYGVIYERAIQNIWVNEFNDRTRQKNRNQYASLGF